MSTQPEAILEADLIQQLIDKSYDSVRINDEIELKANLKIQLEAANDLNTSDPKSLAVFETAQKAIAEINPFLNSTIA